MSLPGKSARLFVPSGEELMGKSASFGTIANLIIATHIKHIRNMFRMLAPSGIDQDATIQRKS